MTRRQAAMPSEQKPGIHTAEEAPGIHAEEALTNGNIHDDGFPKDWVPPGQLDAPPPRQGMVQRWVRRELKGAADGANWSRQYGQGWHPRPMSSIPKAERSKFPMVSHPVYGDVIGQADVILCEMPKRLADKRAAYYKAKRRTQDQMLNEQLDNNGRGNTHKGFGDITMTRKSQSGTRRPRVAAD